MGAVGRKLSRWTPERLRKYKGFELFTDKQAEEAIHTLERLARILLSIYNRNPQINGKFEYPSGVWQGPKAIKGG